MATTPTATCKQFHERKPEHRTRPRVPTIVTAQSGSGKSPFFEQVVTPCFVDTAQRPALTQMHKQLFSDPGRKGHYFSTGTDADFCQRMHVSGGTLFWATDESVASLDANS